MPTISPSCGEDRFERGLTRLLDGVELHIERRRAGSAS
jgi:hypothetical protein